MHHVVIIGGGFGGLYAARALKRAAVRVTLVDRRNFHLFQPLLYQVATGGLSPADICAPLRSVVRWQQDTSVVLGEVTDIDPRSRPVAMQQGSYVARLIRERLRGRSIAPFRYRNRGNLAVIGRAAAVPDLGWLRLTGYPAWLLWLFVHIMYLVEFGNRLLVFAHWAYSYFTRKCGARLITQSDTE
jgi:NADH dehydrogenase FAD-containing subunit